MPPLFDPGFSAIRAPLYRQNPYMDFPRVQRGYRIRVLSGLAWRRHYCGRVIIRVSRPFYRKLVQKIRTRGLR